MQHDFWHQRWQQNQIGFHQEEINPHLQRCWPKLRVRPKGKVFVPLCGKSNDMLWLLSMGYQVVGVELSPLAVESFFSENGLQPIVRQSGNFHIYEISGLQIYCGDFFALQPEYFGNIDAVYDRASLIALPPDLRIEYALNLSELLSPSVEILLIAFDYPQHEMPGPPFSVQEDEVRGLFETWCEITLLGSESILEKEMRFKERGLSRLSEQSYRLTVL
ncbi:MAG: thiopurine S-methyltransferase [Gammaproteobacteria bacterium]